jgi:hypothetical protein
VLSTEWKLFMVLTVVADAALSEPSVNRNEVSRREAWCKPDRGV